MKREGEEKEVRAEVCHDAEDESFPDREHEKREVRKLLKEKSDSRLAAFAERSMELLKHSQEKELRELLEVAVPRAPSVLELAAAREGVPGLNRALEEHLRHYHIALFPCNLTVRLARASVVRGKGTRFPCHAHNELGDSQRAEVAGFFPDQSGGTSTSGSGDCFVFVESSRGDESSAQAPRQGLLSWFLARSERGFKIRRPSRGRPASPGQTPAHPWMSCWSKTSGCCLYQERFLALG